MMRILLTVFLVPFLVTFSPCSCIRLESNASVFDVTSFGAVGDGKTDDSQAFLKAWQAACGSVQGIPTLYIPPARAFMLKPVWFAGPCKSDSVSVELRGMLLAPGYTWDCSGLDAWIRFSDIAGLTIYGGGIINGQGPLWWKSCNPNITSPGCRNRPTALHVHNCNGLRLTDIQHVNSPRNHIGINSCNGANISKLKIFAPGDSPNTDGIDVAVSSNVNIRDTIIATGDDCVAVNGGTSFLNITRVICGPGHGISIGSLGTSQGYDTVEEIHVRNCTIQGTTNGVRIKTNKEGSGYARKITFEKIHFINSTNPIIIDQHYVKRMDENGKRGVEVSDVTYSEVYGTSDNEAAITLNCTQEFGCNNIVMDQVNITSAKPGMKVYAVCTNVKGKASSVWPVVDCLAT